MPCKPCVVGAYLFLIRVIGKVAFEAFEISLSFILGKEVVSCYLSK